MKRGIILLIGQDVKGLREWLGITLSEGDYDYNVIILHIDLIKNFKPDSLNLSGCKFDAIAIDITAIDSKSRKEEIEKILAETEKLHYGYGVSTYFLDEGADIHDHNPIKPFVFLGKMARLTEQIKSLR